MLAMINPNIRCTLIYQHLFLVHLFTSYGANVHCHILFIAIHYLHPEVVSAVVRTAEVFSY